MLPLAWGGTHSSVEEQSRPANCNTLTGKDKMGKTINLCCKEELSVHLTTLPVSLN